VSPPLERSRLPRSVWIATAVWLLSATADSFLLFTLFWIAGPQSWSGVTIALIVVALRAPTIAGGLLGGRAVDRFGGRPLILLDVASRTVLMLALAIAGWQGVLPLAAVLVAGGLAGGLAPLSYAGVRWLVPRLVSARALPDANAALSLGDQLPLLLSAALVGPVLELLGPGRGLLVPTAALALATGLATCLPRGQECSCDLGETPTARVLGDSDPPAGSPWRSSGVVAIVGLSVAYYTAYGPFEPASPPFVRDQLGGEASAYGLLWTLFGLGAIATLPLASRLSRPRPGLSNGLGAVVWGMVMLPVAFTGEVWLAAVIFLIGGAVWGPYSAIEATALQRWVHPSQHGRVFGAQRALLLTAAPAGAAVGALALDYVAAGTVMAFSSAACAIAGLVALCVPALRGSGITPMETTDAGWDGTRRRAVSTASTS
jgi:predicted MFS family arabinose efflux permease